jgi:SAM-dependent methyltransferase
MTHDYRAYEDDSVDVDPESPIFHAHLSRYWWARAQAEGADVLDCACGKGYGTYLLACVAQSALGIDLNTASLDEAGRSFQRPNLAYRPHDVLRLPDLGRRFDLITAFEIIEHLAEPETDRFLSGLAACLRPGGRLLLSTPNHTVVRRSGSVVPEYHINNFTPGRLRRTLRRHFGSVRLLGQYRSGGPLYQVLFALDVWNLRHAAGAMAGLARRPEAAHTRPVAQAQGRRDLTEAGYFRQMPEACRAYRISPWHWRQAGITVALCERPAEPPGGAPA